ncbi:UDPglucose 6-dehydrogenase [Methanolinea mesophila]|uniref:UDP-glucose dehydrogenase family protein n=1 Tax=Methanolinea mesophila TaxID=547055 RepID=UPI001FD80960|nr:UDP-glucose/GDP-mannose dehydrogenase family protein [Methanolinea mesophila]MBP1928365.1 UDPglucose 6-dehydrogenase [Methanolinea mesophila]
MNTMHITVIGTGYVGAVTGACLAEMGHNVVFVGRDQRKLDLISSGVSPIFEKGLDDLLERNTARIRTTTDLAGAVRDSEVTFVCVGTPSLEDGSIDLGQVEEVSRTIGKSLGSDGNYRTIIMKSTVLPGTTETIVIPILERESGKKAFLDFGVASNPEFLKEGTAVEDFFYADRVVIGVHDDRSRKVMEQVYEPLDAPVFFTTLRTSEMIKYTSNAFLATKISFANEIGNLCKKLGIDSYEVFEGVGMDSRIGHQFFRSGIGFGGSCFPKDVRALIAHARATGIEPFILDAVMERNEAQPANLVSLLERHLELRGKTIGVLGLAFKPDSDDVRESRAVPVIRALLREGARVVAFDPIAADNFRPLFPDIRYAGTAKEVLDADAVLIVTEWKEFEDLDYRGKIVIDGRRIARARREAAIYEGVCW